MTSNRGYVGGKFALELDGSHAGWIYSVEGGNYGTEVVSEKIGGDKLIRKHPAGVKYEPISVSCGAGMTKAFTKWIEKSLQHEYERKSGAVLMADFDQVVRTRMNFHDALISEISFPGLDAATKDVAKMNIKIEPESTNFILSDNGGKVTPQGHSLSPRVQKLWTTQNFRFRIDNVKMAKVSKVEALTVKQKNTENAVGDGRNYQHEPAYIEYPNLVFSLSQSHAGELVKWAEDFIVKGNSGTEAEKNAVLEFLAPDLQTVLATIDFYHVGPIRFTPEKFEAGTENIARIKFECYIEELKVHFKEAWN